MTRTALISVSDKTGVVELARGLAALGLRILSTGGTAKLPGIEEAATRVFSVSARRGESPGWVKDELKDPMFSTVLGVFQFGLRAAHEHALPPRRKTGLLSNLTKIFAVN